MKTKRKIWYLQKKDILYVEENHDGKMSIGKKLVFDSEAKAKAWLKKQAAITE